MGIVKHRFSDMGPGLLSLAQDEASVLESFQISAFLVLGKPDEGTDLYRIDRELQLEFQTPLLCNRCPTDAVILKNEDDRRFRKALMALNLDPELVNELKEYSCVRNDGCHM